MVFVCSLLFFVVCVCVRVCACVCVLGGRGSFFVFFFFGKTDFHSLVYIYEVIHCEGFGTTHAVLGGRLSKTMKIKELLNNMLFCVKIIIENKYYIKYMHQPSKYDYKPRRTHILIEIKKIFKNALWILKRIVSLRRFFKVPKTNILIGIKENYQIVYVNYK